MTTMRASWPVKEAYDDAIRQRVITVPDPDIRNGKLFMHEGSIRQYGGANLYVRLYRVDHWFVRCFCSDARNNPPDDIITRYQAIDRFYQIYAKQVPALLSVKYVEEGIRINSQFWPFVKMEFSEAPRLGNYVEHYYRDRNRMNQLCEAWLYMIQTMEKVPMAHGDLDLTNVLVQQQSAELTLKMIDYDNLWIKTLENYPQTEYGHEHFQHPDYIEPGSRPYNSEMDRFSALVMYLSLSAFVTHPDLYDEWTADGSNRLLLSQTDYIEYQRNGGGRIMQLRELCLSQRPDLIIYLDALQRSLTQHCMPPSMKQIAAQGPSLPRPPRYNFENATYPASNEQIKITAVPSSSSTRLKSGSAATASTTRRWIISIAILIVLIIITVLILLWLHLGTHNNNHSTTEMTVLSMSYALVSACTFFG